MDSALISLVAIILLGISAQWVSWRFGWPSILVLLVCGFVVGPGLGYIKPNELFGDLLMPFVSISVAIILFEGGLNLRLSDLRDVGKVVGSLVVFGILITWAIVGTAAYYLLDLRVEVAALLGAILVVTGPTVVQPLLLHIRPKGQVGPILRWEGILNDAAGAVLAVLVYEAVILGSIEEAPIPIIIGLGETLMIGIVGGAVGAYALTYLLRPNRTPEHLRSPLALAFVIGAFTASNAIQHESGLLTVTIMGVFVANQRSINVRELVAFKENLVVLLLSMLFVLLAARLEREQIELLGWGSVGFAAVLIFVARPVSIYACTAISSLTFKERTFLAFMAPRGIVAAAVTSVFALRMAEENIPQADRLVPVTFLVITVTVAFYGLTARTLARGLGLAQSDRQGLVITGAHPFARRIALALQEEGFRVLLIDINRRYVNAARLEGLDARYGDALSESLVDELDLGEIGKLLALTGNDYVNSLAALHFSAVLGEHDVYQLASDLRDLPGAEADQLPSRLRGHTLFGNEWTHAELVKRSRHGALVKRTKLTEEFGYEQYLEQYGDKAVPMFIITEGGKVLVRSEGDNLLPRPGQKIVALVSTDAA
jgi:NhaP-type Na+/H+ or K+/H+ antiporter